MTEPASSSKAAPGRVSFKEELAAYLEAQRGARDALPLESLVWLVTSPAWTVRLARACGLPAGAVATPEALVEELVEQRILAPSSRPVKGPGGTMDTVYSMTEAACRDVADRLAREKPPGWAREHLAAAGAALLGSAPREAPSLVQATSRAAQLAAAAGEPGRPAALLLEKVGEQVGQRVPFGPDPDARIADASRWIDAAKRLSPFIERLDVAAARGARLLELYQVRADDERRLGSFLERKDQTDAFRALAARADGEWALHYMGSAGFGKTTLLRFIAGRLAPELGLATARVDFDLLHPDYPLQKPWLLVELLAEQLRLHDPSGEYFFAFDNAVLQVREALSEGPPGEARSQELWKSYGVVDRLADALAAMPQPAVLLFDTCEELARVGAGATSDAPPNVLATLALVEELRAAEQRGGRPARTRVVFFGRRPLPERDFIERFRVTGFTDQEVAAYLEIALPRPTYAALLDDPRTLEAVKKRSRVSQGGEAVPRYNPFEAAFCAGWLRDEPDTALDSLDRVDGDAYVKVRIVGRVASPGVLELLPAAAVLGRFDAQMLRPAWSGDDAGFTAAYEALRRHEYVHPAGQQLEIEPELAPRLLAYFDGKEPARMAAVRRALLDHVDDLVRQSDFASIDPRRLESLARLVLLEGERAADRWSAIERRLVAARKDEVLERLCDRLLGDDGLLSRDAVANDDRKAFQRAAMLVGYASSKSRAAPLAAVEPHHREVIALVKVARGRPSDAPDKEATARTADALVCRARAGIVAATCARGALPDAGELADLWESAAWLVRSPPIDEELAAAVLAAIDSLLEVGVYQPPASWLPRDPTLPMQLTIALAGSIESGLAAFASALEGRTLALTGAVAGAAAAFDRAESYVFEAAPRRWLDWRAPADLRTRIRLDLITALYGLLPAERLARRARAWRAELQTDYQQTAPPDADRLLSASLLVERAHEVFAIAPWESSAVPQLQPTGEPPRVAHRIFPPARVAFSEILGLAGYVEDALGTGSEHRRGFERMATGEVADAASRANLRLALRMRIPLHWASVTSSPDAAMLASKSPDDWDLGFAVRGLLGGGLHRETVPLPDVRHASRWDHAMWRATPIRSESDTESALSLLTAPWPLDEANSRFRQGDDWLHPGVFARLTWGDVSLLADRLEARAVLATWHEEVPPADTSISLDLVEKWCAANMHWAGSGLRLALRVAVLEGAPLDRLAPIVERVGRLRAAEIALEEASLLALRLPAPAGALFRWARARFEDSGDAFGALLATTYEIASVRASGGRFADADGLDRIQKEYESANLPALTGVPWSRLEEVSDHPDAGALLELGPRAYRGLLVRIALCLPRRSDGDAERWSAVSTVLRETFSDPRGGVPPDLDGLLTARAGRRAVRRAPRRHAGLEHALTIKAEASRAEIGAAELMLRPLTARSSMGRVTASVPLDPRAPPRETARALPPDLVAEIARLPEGAPLVLDLDPGTSVLTWETVLTEVLPPRPLLRTLPGARRFGRPASHPIQHVHAWTLSEAQSSALSYGWRPAGRGAVLHHRSQLDPVDAIDVAHFVVTPVPTTRGCRATLVEDDFKLRFQQNVQQQRFFTNRGGSADLLDASQIATAYPTLCACVLQMPPLWDLNEPTDRSQLAFLHVFAAELHLAGVPNVVVIPSLPADEGAAVIEQLAKAWGRPDWPLHLAETALRCRTLFGSGTPLAAAAMDLAVLSAPAD